MNTKSYQAPSAILSIQAPAYTSKLTHHAPQTCACKYLDTLPVTTYAMSFLEDIIFPYEDTELIINDEQPPELYGYEIDTTKAIYNAQRFIGESVADNTATYTADYLQEINQIAVKAQSIHPGVFRDEFNDEHVTPSDNDHSNTPHTGCRQMVEAILNNARTIENPLERAVSIAAQLIVLQPFFDGNKRTSILFASASLMMQGFQPIYISALKYREYRQALHELFANYAITSFAHVIYEDYNTLNKLTSQVKGDITSVSHRKNIPNESGQKNI